MRTAAAVLPLVAVLAVPATAAAAPKPGTYAGTSSGQVQSARDDEPVTDRGTVRFKVASGKATGLVVRGQEFSCGGQRPEVLVQVASIRLGATTGRGTARYMDPVVGRFDVTLTVTSGGAATGTVVARGLCKGTARLTAKRR